MVQLDMFAALDRAEERKVEPPSSDSAEQVETGTCMRCGKQGEMLLVITAGGYCSTLHRAQYLQNRSKE